MAKAKNVNAAAPRFATFTDLARHGLVELAERYGKAKGLALTSVGLYAVKDARFFTRVRDDKDFGLTTLRYDQARSWFSRHWPEGVPWPHDLVRWEPKEGEQSPPVDGMGWVAVEKAAQPQRRRGRPRGGAQQRRASQSRNEAIAAYRARGHTLRETAEQFSLSIGSIVNIMRAAANGSQKNQRAAAAKSTGPSRKGRATASQRRGRGHRPARGRKAAGTVSEP
jgi:DNA-binding CsgD family transcriptional regulator